jgi:large subunit ribosomal protein L25
MPEITSLNAERRARTGKGAARAMRRMGRVPGIIYGGNQDPMLISLDPRELSSAVAKRGFLATLVDVKVDSAVEHTLPREVQYHPVTDKPVHVDFTRVGADTRVTVTVPVVFINHEMSIGLRRGGILNIVRHGVDLTCRADSIPEQLVVNLDGLDIGDSVHASAVSFPAGSRPMVTDRDFTIASIAAPSALREEAAAAAAAPPPAAEQPAAG